MVKFRFFIKNNVNHSQFFKKYLYIIHDIAILMHIVFAEEMIKNGVYISSMPHLILTLFTCMYKLCC